MTARGPVELITTGSAMIAEPGSTKIAEPGSAMIVGPASYLAVPPSTRLNNPFVTGLLFENSHPSLHPKVSLDSIGHGLVSVIISDT